MPASILAFTMPTTMGSRGNADNAEDEQGEVVTHHRQIAEEVTRIDEGEHPQEAAHQIERQEAG